MTGSGKGGESNPAEVALALIGHRLDSIEKAAKESVTLLREINGRTRDNERCIAQLDQWREDHGETHVELRDQVRTLGQRVWTLFGLNTIGNVIASIIGWLRGA